MNWKLHITSDPSVLRGKPVVKGTRIAVDFLLDLYAKGWTTAQVLGNYPQLSEAQLQSIFSFSADRLRDEVCIELDTGTSD